MANISTAEGTLHITAPDKYTMDLVAKLLHVADDWGYNTSFDIDAIGYTGNNDGTTSGFVQFYGSGRWTYMTNAQHYFTWLQDEISDDSNLLSDAERQALDAAQFSVDIIWHEYETGAMFVGRGHVSHQKSANTPWYEVTTEIIEDENDELTVATLNKYGFDGSQWADFSKEGIQNFIDYFDEYDPSMLGDLTKYHIDQLAQAMRGKEHFAMYELEYLEDKLIDCEDYRETILESVRSK